MIGDANNLIELGGGFIKIVILDGNIDQQMAVVGQGKTDRRACARMTPLRPRSRSLVRTEARPNAITATGSVHVCPGGVRQSLFLPTM